MREVRKLGGVRRSLACGARLPHTLYTTIHSYMRPNTSALLAYGIPVQSSLSVAPYTRLSSKLIYSNHLVLGFYLT
jgi:hypothetical protein